jgi:signal peptidase
MKIINTVITVFSIVGGLVGLLIIANHYKLTTGLQVLVVMSGSMEPDIPVGSVVAVRSADSYLTNDVISFYTDETQKNIVTHRILDKQYPYGIHQPTQYVTIGDANDSVDQTRVKDEQIIGKVNIVIPYIGYVADFAKKPYGFILLVIVPVTIIIYEELKKLGQEFKQTWWRWRQKDTSRTTANSGIITLAVIIPILMAALSLTSISFSYFSDQEDSHTNEFQAGTWITPTPTNLPTPTTIPLADHIVINEFLYDPVDPFRFPGEEKSEWVEFYNPTSNPIDISNWSLSDNHNCNFLPIGSNIPAGGFAILSPATETEFRTIWSVPAGVIFIKNPDQKIGNGLANNDRLILKNGNCLSINIVDQVGYGSDPTQPTLDPVDPGHSFERNPDGIDTNAASDFTDRYPPTPGS